MSYLRVGDKAAGQRWREAEQQKAVLAAKGISVDILADSPVSARAQQLARNFQNGYFAVPADLFFTPGPKFDRKHSPAVSHVVERDLRPLANAMYAEMPVSALQEQGDELAEIHAQVAWIHAGILGGPYYRFTTLDMLNALYFFNSVRNDEHVERRGPGRTRLTYPGGITIDMYGVGGKPRVFNIAAHGLPSRSGQARQEGISEKVLQEFEKEERSYSPQYRLELCDRSFLHEPEPAKGVFRIDSSIPPWDLLLQQYQRIWNGRVAPDNEDVARRYMQQLYRIYMQDIFVIYAAENHIIRKRRNVDSTAGPVEINHPFRWFQPHWIRLASTMLEQVTIVDGKEKKKPKLSQIEKLLNLNLGVRRDELASERPHYGAFSMRSLLR